MHQFPFEQVACDIFYVGKHIYLVYVDRFSGWLEIAKLKDESHKSVKKHLLKWYRDFGAPDIQASDGGPPFNGQEYKGLLKRWGIEDRRSSAYYPQSNGRAEVAVKTAKRLLMGNLNPVTGELDTEQATRALMTHRNTPGRETNLSPAEILYGHKLRDHLPNKNRKLRQTWRSIRKAKELKHHHLPKARKKRTLEPLKLGQAVSVQNQKGNKPKKWHNTGKVVEVLPYRKYRVLLDGSRNVTERNRKFLRAIPEQARHGSDPGPPLPPGPPPSSGSTQPSEHSHPHRLLPPPGHAPSELPSELPLDPPLQLGSTPPPSLGRLPLSVQPPIDSISSSNSPNPMYHSTPLRGEIKRTRRLEPDLSTSKIQKGTEPLPATLRRSTRMKRPPARYRNESTANKHQIDIPHTINEECASSTASANRVKLAVETFNQRKKQILKNRQIKGQDNKKPLH